ncbi:MAG: hypothetical protein WCP23_04890 [Planctomycetota bacterium]
MSVGFLPPGVIRSYGEDLARIPLRTLGWPLGESHGLGKDGDDAFVGDLGADNDLVLCASSRSLWARRRNVRCRVSLVIWEPPAVQGRLYKLLRWCGRSYHRVFTHQMSLCKVLRNARLVEHGGTTLKASPENSFTKTSMVSLVASTKNDLPGHRLRHRVAAWSRTAYETLKLYGHAYEPVVDKAEAHAPFRYSVVIENSRCSGYFTEKLIDSMLCSSIPIYWGDPSIGSHFDPRGVVVCETQADIRKAILQSSHGDYEHRRPFLEANQLVAKRLARSMIHRACDTLRDEQNKTGTYPLKSAA